MNKKNFVYTHTIIDYVYTSIYVYMYVHMELNRKTRNYLNRRFESFNNASYLFHLNITFLS